MTQQLFCLQIIMGLVPLVLLLLRKFRIYRFFIFLYFFILTNYSGDVECTCKVGCAGQSEEARDRMLLAADGRMYG